MTDPTFLETFAQQYAWKCAPAKRRFRYRKQVNRGMREKHRLALTLNGVIDRDIEDLEGLQSSDFSTYQIFEKDNLVFKLIDLENIRTSRVGHVPCRGIMSPAYIRLEATSDDTHPRYYYWLFFAAYINNIFNGMGGGVRQNLTPTDLLEFPVPLLDRDSQVAIAEFLDRETARIDKLIHKKLRLLSVLEQKWNSTVTSTLSNGLDSEVPRKDSRVSWIGEIPAHWNVAMLGHIGRCANGINVGGDAFGSGYPFVSYGDAYRNPALPETVDGLVQSTPRDRARYSLKAGDVLFTRTSETIDEIGISSVCLQDMPDAVYAGFLIRFRPIEGRLDPHYSKFLFRNAALRSFFAREMMIVTRASLSQDLLRKMPVLLPPLPEQREIAAHLGSVEDTMLSISEKTTKSIEKLKEFRSALITETVTGQIDLKEWRQNERTDRRLDDIERVMTP